MLLTVLFCVLELHKSTVTSKIHFKDQNQLLAGNDNINTTIDITSILENPFCFPLVWQM